MSTIKTEDPFVKKLPKTIQDRFPARRRSLESVWWGFWTNVQKKWIASEDRLGSYGYMQWIRAVEPVTLNRMVCNPPLNRLNKPSVCFVIAQASSSQQNIIQTLSSLRAQEGLDWSAVFLLPEDKPKEPWMQNLFSDEMDLHSISVKALADWVIYADRFPGDWLVPLRAGDELAVAWSKLFSIFVNRNPQADLIYWDEDNLNTYGDRCQPFFKPDWSPELLFSINYLKTAAFRKAYLIDALRVAGGGAQGWIFDVTAAARQVVHIPAVLQHCLLQSKAERSQSVASHALDVRAALERRAFEDVNVVAENDLGVRASWAVDVPFISIIIPTRNNIYHLKRCISSLFSTTQGVNFEILLMDDHSTDPEVLAYYQELRESKTNLRIQSNPGEFNYSQVNNSGARFAKGDLLLFLNNDVEALHPDWLVEMTRWVQMPGIGIVGAKLHYPEQTIQHAGIVLGMTGHAGHIFAGKLPESGGIFASPNWYRNVSAVTGACMLMRREIFEKLGGFDEELVLVFNDVDICLRCLDAGYRIVYTPAATLIHHEGVSRSRYMPPHDIRLGAERLAAHVRDGDRYYNPNLSLAVNWPTYHRMYEPLAVDRLKKIVQYKG